MKHPDVLVYIASPYTRGDQAMNVRFQHKVWEVLMDIGVVPIAPLWTHYQHIFEPRKYQDWVDYDNAIIQRCDACIRLAAYEGSIGYHQAESTGADNEVSLFKKLGKPVFHSTLGLVEWLKEREASTNELA